MKPSTPKPLHPDYTCDGLVDFHPGCRIRIDPDFDLMTLTIACECIQHPNALVCVPVESILPRAPEIRQEETTMREQSSEEPQAITE